MNTPNPTFNDERRIALEAQEWVSKLPFATAPQRLEFEHWLRQSPIHVREIVLALVWEEMRNDVLDNCSIDLDELIELTRSEMALCLLQ